MKTVNRKLILTLCLLGVVGLSFESGTAVAAPYKVPDSCNQAFKTGYTYMGTIYFPIVSFSAFKQKGTGEMYRSNKTSGEADKWCTNYSDQLMKARPPQQLARERANYIGVHQGEKAALEYCREYNKLFPGSITSVTVQTGVTETKVLKKHNGHLIQVPVQTVTGTKAVRCF